MGFWQIIGAGWRGAFGAVRFNAVLFGATFCALLLVQWLMQTFLPLSPPATGKFALSGFLMVRTAVQTILDCICVAPCMVSVHRFVLVDEVGSVLRDKKRLFIFATVLIIIRLLPYTFLSLVFISPFLIIFMLVSIWLSFKLILTFPAIALDRPMPLRDSWHRTAKRWWYVFGVLFFGLIAISLLGRVLQSLFSPMSDTAIQSPVSIPIYLFGTAIVVMAYPVVGAALASELFKKFGGMDHQPVM